MAFAGNQPSLFKRENVRWQIDAAATPAGDGRGEVELNSVKLTTERRANAANGFQAHLKMRVAEKSLQLRYMYKFSKGNKIRFSTNLQQYCIRAGTETLSQLASYYSLHKNGGCSKEAGNKLQSL